MERAKFCLHGLQRRASCTAHKRQGQDEQQQNRRQHPQKRDALRRFGRGGGLLPGGQGCVAVCGILPCLCGIDGKLALGQFRCHTGGDLQRRPALPGKINLCPGVGVIVLQNRTAAAVARSGEQTLRCGIAHHIPGGQPHHAAEQHRRRGELRVVACMALVQKIQHGVGSGRCGSIGAVSAALVQPTAHQCAAPVKVIILQLALF